MLLCGYGRCLCLSFNLLLHHLLGLFISSSGRLLESLFNRIVFFFPLGLFLIGSSFLVCLVFTILGNFFFFLGRFFLLCLCLFPFSLIAAKF